MSTTTNKIEFVPCDYPCLEEALAETLYEDFVVTERPLPWIHRGYGRFTYDLSDTQYGQAVKDTIINQPKSPVYGDKHFDERSSVWIQCFVPGAVLPLHREYVRGVYTIYLSKDIKPDDESGFMEWHEAQDINRLYDEPIHRISPTFNTGSYYINPDIDADQKIYNPWHRVHRNNGTSKRYSLQIFEPVHNNTQANNISDSNQMINSGHLQALGWDKALINYPEDHKIFDYSAWLPEILQTWQKENKDLIASMTL